MIKHVSFILLLGLGLSGPLVFGYDPKLAIAYNKSGDSTSTSTSNPMENHIAKGVDMAIDQFGEGKFVTNKNVFWIDHGEAVAPTLKAIEEINKIKPDYVVGMGNSFQALLCAERFNPKTTLISPVATSDEIRKKNKDFILISNTNSVQAMLLVKHFQGIHKARKDEVLVLKLKGCPYCEDFGSQIIDELRKQKISYNELEIQHGNIRHMTEITLPASAPTEIFVPAHEAEAARLIELFANAGFRGRFWGGDGWGSDGRFLLRIASPNPIWALWLTHYYPTIDNEANLKFVREYEKRYKMKPVDTSAFYYEAAHLAILLSKQLPKKTVSKDLFDKALRLTGPVKWSDNTLIRPMPLLEVKEHKIKLLKLVGAQ